MHNDEQQELSTRVNSARLSDFLQKTVRLPCKVLRNEKSQLMVEASDGGQVTVTVVSNADVTDTYIEVIGKVLSPSSIQMFACVGLGSNLDMKLVNDTIELIHDPRFYQKMFS